MIHVYATRLRRRSGYQKQSEQARRLLDMALKREYPAACAPVRVEKDKLGKPYLPAYPGIFISLTHSGSYVACAFGEKPVGVDLEVWKTRGNQERIVERFHPLEREAYQKTSEEEKERIFYTLWVQKESFVKALGCGLRLALDACCLLPDGEKVLQTERKEDYYYRLYSLEGEPRSSLAVCSEEKEFPAVLAWLTLPGEISESQQNF